MLKLGKTYILGDSYSTFVNCIPEGNACYYSGGGDVTDKKQTWWYRLLDNTESELIKNNSYSGSTVCNTGYNGYCPESSFIGRFDKDSSSGFFKENMPDTFLIFGGTNDTWADSPIGEPVFGEWTEDDLKCALPAFCYLLNNISKNLSQSKIVVILNTDLKKEICDGFTAISKEYGAYSVQLCAIDKRDGHPTALGMMQIYEQVYNFLNSKRGFNK